jgi:hypothetical protein
LGGCCCRKAPAQKRPRQTAKAAAGTSTGRLTGKRRKKGNDKILEPEEPSNSLKGIFARELGDIMFAYGDTSRTPVPETVDALEALAILFVRSIISKAFENVRQRSPYFRLATFELLRVIVPLTWGSTDTNILFSHSKQIQLI